MSERGGREGEREKETHLFFLSDKELLDDIIHPDIVTKHGDFLPPLSHALYNIAREGYAMKNEEFESVLRVCYDGTYTPREREEKKKERRRDRDRGRDRGRDRERERKTEKEKKKERRRGRRREREKRERNHFKGRFL